MLVTFLTGILIGAALFLFPILIGISLFFMLIKRLKDKICRKNEDSS
mgnify:CR=1 FL=1